MDAILTFHSIDGSGSVLSYAPDDLSRLLEGLLEDGVRIVSLGDLLRPDSSVDRVTLTFDDGLTSVRSEALPVIERLGVPALVYVVSAWLGKQNRWPSQPAGAPEFTLMSAEELRELHGAGFEIGDHTANHVRLDQADPADLSAELDQSRASLEEQLGVSVRHFSYPYGFHNAAALERVGEVYDTAVTTRHSFLSGADEPLLLPRLDAYYLRRADRHRPLFGMRNRCYQGLRSMLRGLRQGLGG